MITKLSHFFLVSTIMCNAFIQKQQQLQPDIPNHVVTVNLKQYEHRKSLAVCEKVCSLWCTAVRGLRLPARLV